MKNQTSLTGKQREFNKAMESYHSHNYYQYIYRLISVTIVTLQFVLFVKFWGLNLSLSGSLIALFIAYFLTDFINGYVHMYMDNNDSYTSVWGSFIASFHLHHKTNKYKDAHILLIYFNESGAKFWLVPYLLLVLILSYLSINQFILFILILIGILSSLAEVSHYLCHNDHSKFVTTLQKYRILLPVLHHERHHQNENENYAFLNGSSDFILNVIAKKFYKGYKDGSDKHFERYEGMGTDNRG